MQMTVQEVRVQRVSIVTSASFDTVVARINAAIGHPDMVAFRKSFSSAQNLSEMETVAVRTAKGVATDLAENIAHRVRWHDATSVAQELGAELILNVPPGHVLSDLAKENISGVQARPVTPDNFKIVLELAKP